MAMVVATAAIRTPAPMYDHQSPTRSAIHPPSTQPTALASPLRAPVTSATVSADARQSGATADHRLLAAPAPTGDDTRTMTKRAMGERTSALKSVPIARSPWP